MDAVLGGCEGGESEKEGWLTMAEYIERKAVLRPFIIDKQGRRIKEVDVDNWEVSVSIRSVKNIIREVPAADVVEVVRCGECKSWCPISNGKAGTCK